MDAASSVALPSQVRSRLTYMVESSSARAILESAIGTKVSKADSSVTVKLTSMVAPTTTYITLTPTPTSDPSSATAAQFEGTMTLQVSDAAAFVANEQTRKAVSDGIAKSVGVLRDNVETTLSTSRRLVEAQGRSLTAGSVDAAYKIIIPLGAPSSVASPSQVENMLTNFASDPQALAQLSNAVADEVKKVDASQSLTVTGASLPAVTYLTVATTSETMAGQSTSTSSTIEDIIDGVERLGPMRGVWIAAGLLGSLAVA